jgi:hypothetical protein
MSPHVPFYSAIIIVGLAMTGYGLLWRAILLKRRDPSASLG